jgi:hypothetical protein
MVSFLVGVPDVGVEQQAAERYRVLTRRFDGACRAAKNIGEDFDGACVIVHGGFGVVATFAELFQFALSVI